MKDHCSSFVTHFFSSEVKSHSSFITPHSSLIILLCLLFLVSSPFTFAIDISQDFKNIKDRQYFLRLGVIQSTDSVRLVPEGDFYLHDKLGTIIYNGTGGTYLYLTCRDTRVARKVYYQIFATFEPEQIDQAQALAQRLTSLTGRKISMQNDPEQDLTPSPAGGLPSRLPRLVVALGPSSSRDSVGWKYNSLASGTSEKPKMLETYEAETKGKIEVRDREGKLVAAADGYIGVWPKKKASYIHVKGADSMGSEPCDPDPAYRGLVEFWINPRGHMTVVNRIFIEHYLYGVLPGELGHNTPLEMKKVQTVISRSGAIAKLRQSSLHAGWHFDFCAEQHCQVYKGAHREDPETNRAVDSTMGQICTYQNEIIDAVFSQSCGGVTANNEEVWEAEPDPYLRSVNDGPSGQRPPDLSSSEAVERFIHSEPNVFCNPNQGGFPSYADSYHWTRTCSAQEILNGLSAWGICRGSQLRDLRVAERLRTGRVFEMTVTTDEGSFRMRRDQTIRGALGSFYSTFFIMKPSYDSSGALSQVTFEGIGRGHGVGLCQLGAMAMARRGYDYISILKHYYAGIDIYKIYK